MSRFPFRIARILPGQSLQKTPGPANRPDPAASIAEGRVLIPTSAAPPATPSANAPLRRVPGDRPRTWLVAAEDPSVRDALEAWARRFRAQIPGAFLESQRHLLLVTRRRGEWRAVGGQPFRAAGSPEAREELLTARPARPWRPGRRQLELLAQLKATGEVAATCGRDRRALAALEFRGFLTSEIQTTPTFPATVRRIYRRRTS